MALDTLPAPDNLSRVLGLPSLVFSLDPLSFLRLQQTSRELYDEKDSPIAAWYWRRMILAQLPNCARLSVIKDAVGEATDAAQWRRVFLDFDAAFVNAKLMSTRAEYEKFYTAKNKLAGGAPPDLEFDSPSGATACQLSPTRRLGENRMVVGSQPLPLPVSCTSSRQENEWRFGYRVAQGYFEVELGPAPGGPRWEDGTPCVSVGLCTSDIAPRSVMCKQVGWCRNSWGLHGDDGQIYHAGGIGLPFCPYGLEDLLAPQSGPRRPAESKSDEAVFGMGDVIGCGTVLLPSTGCCGRGYERGVFYTKNGRFLGVAFLLDEPGRPLYPCAGVDTHGTTSFNFGARPFVFDVDSLGSVLVRHRTSAGPLSGKLRGAAESPAPGAMARLATLKQAAVKLRSRVADSVTWIRRRGRDLVHPFYGLGERP